MGLRYLQKSPVFCRVRYFIGKVKIWSIGMCAAKKWNGAAAN